MRTHAYQEPGKRKKWPVKRHPKKLNVWAAAGAYMQSKLYFFKENMNAPLYQKVIRSHLQEDRITFAADCPRHFRVHTIISKTTRNGTAPQGA